MWYAIFILLGLSVGIGMMVWALLERKKRFAAEQKAAQEYEYRMEAVKVADSNRVSAERIKQDLDKANEAVDRLFKELNDTKQLLIKCGNPAALKDWLSSELKGGQL